MFTGLGHDRVVCRDYQQGEVESGSTGQHVADEAFMAGHIDHTEFEPREVELREAYVNRDATGFFFWQAVAIDAGESPHQRCLAMIDMSGSAQNERPGGSMVHAGILAKPNMHWIPIAWFCC